MRERNKSKNRKRQRGTKRKGDEGQSERYGMSANIVSFLIISVNDISLSNT